MAITELNPIRKQGLSVHSMYNKSNFEFNDFRNNGDNIRNSFDIGIASVHNQEQKMLHSKISSYDEFLNIFTSYKWPLEVPSSPKNKNKKKQTKCGHFQ